MISELRNGAAKMLNLIQAKQTYDNISWVSRTVLQDMLTAAEVPFKIHDYDGGFYNRRYLLITGPYEPARVMSGSSIRDIEQRKANVIEDQQKRLQYAAWHSFLRVLRSSSAYNETGYGISTKYIELGQLPTETSTGDGDVMLDALKVLFQAMIDAQITKEILKHSLRDIDDNLKAEVFQIQREGGNAKALGLSTLFDKKPFGGSPGTDVYTHIMDQVQAAYAAMPSNGLTSRTWGYEIEIADAKGVEAPFGIDKGEDGSLRSYESNDDCDCDCDDCVYHDCDCDNCDSRNTDPDHCNNSSCSSADMAEFRTKNGISRLKHAGLFKLCKELSEVEAEVNDTCGVHVHVYAHDLDAKQVANVLAGYKWLENIMAIIAGRDDVNYAKRIPVEYVKEAFKGRMPMDKPRAVNLTHIIGDSTYNRGTIEFRQMAGNHDAEAITIWAWTVRGLVEVCKRGAELKNFMHVTDFNGLVELYAKFNYMLHDEGAELLIPGGQQDNKYITRTRHERV